MSDCSKDQACLDRHEALHLKIGGIAAILVASAIGVAIPLFSKNFNKTKLFYVGQCFAAGVILATGFVHILPDAFEALTSPCLAERPWGKFPFAGFIAMVTASLVLLIDSLAIGYYTHQASLQQTVQAESHNSETAGEVRIHADPEIPRSPHGHRSPHSHGSPHGHGSPHDKHCAQANAAKNLQTQTIRNKVIAQVLEFGILAHSVIIGIAMGSSESPCTVRPLVGALVFHQFFEGLALGGCITTGGFHTVSKLFMSLFFSITTPTGIAIGIGILKTYNENNPNALIVQGIFDSMSAGILIYMSLVDLLSSQFLSEDFLQKPWTHYTLGYMSLFIGTAAMSVIAIWA